MRVLKKINIGNQLSTLIYKYQLMEALQNCIRLACTIIHPLCMVQRYLDLGTGSK